MIRIKRQSLVAGLLLPILVGVVIPAHAAEVEPDTASSQDEATSVEPKQSEPSGAQGYYIGLDLGAFNSHNKDSSKGFYPGWTGFATGLHFGQTVTDYLEIGLAFQMGSASGKHRSVGVFGFGLESSLRLYRSLKLHGLVGVGAASVVDEFDPERDGTGGGYFSAGLSYDFFPFRDDDHVDAYASGGLALRPKLEMRYVPGSSFKSINAFVGAEIRYYFGFPKSQLELPIDHAFVAD